MKKSSVPAYIQVYPKEAQKYLKEMRSIVRAAAPKAEEAVSYGIPTLRIDGKNLVHYGAFTKHIGMYPMTAGARAAAGNALSKYKTTKGSIHFPYTEPLPKALIIKIVKARLKEHKDNYQKRT